ncbi:MAG TPA: alpha/beta hydrolase [Candidatus Ozemobacteraceae bacterium]
MICPAELHRPCAADRGFPRVFPDIRLWPVLLYLLLILAPLGAAVTLPTGPEQPATGPGGKAYPHAGFRITQLGVSEERFVIYEPANPSPASAPLIVFLHGWLASDPGYYIGWIEHLCRRGNTVIFPFYQGSGAHLSEYTANAVRSVKEALTVLYSGGHAEPDRDRVALIGHECGGAIAMNIAASAKYFKLPRPGAVMVLHPSRQGGLGANLNLDLYDLSGIRPGTLLLIAVGDEDGPSVQETARELFYAADAIPAADKNFLTYRSDIRGTPALVADSASVYTPREPRYERLIEQRRWEFIRLNRQTRLSRHIRCMGNDAMDWLGNFRLFDALCHAAWTGHDRDLVLGDGEAVRFMGIWSDGRRIDGPLATNRP